MTCYRVFVADVAVPLVSCATMDEALRECRTRWGSRIVWDTVGNSTSVWACKSDAQDAEGAPAVAEIVRVDAQPIAVEVRQ